MRRMRHAVRTSKRGSRLFVFLLALLAIVPFTYACGGDNGEEETTSPTAAATTPATPEGTSAATPAAGEAAPGITNTEIILGQHAMLSGTFGAVYAILPQTQRAYFSTSTKPRGEFAVARSSSRWRTTATTPPRRWK